MHGRATSFRRLGENASAPPTLEDPYTRLEQSSGRRWRGGSRLFTSYLEAAWNMASRVA